MIQRLKSLELNGYKTFAAKTKFDFDGRVTAVVGPNGSGKSNVADALRWVLGEQSYRLLRGRKTDDMIFAGSETKARAGMASATVTFDNSDGWLPIDFSEVSITRRAFRDGQNEYLINNQRVRLRDVTELLSKSGLAERTYTVIGQGLVDTALSLKPEERRRLFEEAAGIGLYRRRKELSLRRLDKTRRNLERVQDILAELQPRLRSLERQAKRAQQYEQVRDDLQAVLREWYGYHWHRAQREFLEARSAASAQEGALEKARSGQTEMNQSLGEVRDQVNGLRARLNSWHRELAQIHIRREETSRDLAVSGERQRALVERKVRLSSEFATMQEGLGIAEVRLEEALTEAARVHGQVFEAEGEAQKARQALNERQAARQMAESVLEETRGKINELTEQRVELSTRQKDLESRLRGHATNKEEVESALGHSQEALSEVEGRLAEAEKSKGLVESRLRQGEDVLADKRRVSKDLEAKREETASGIVAVEGELARHRAKLEVLEQAEKNMTGYAEGAKYLLEAAGRGELLGAKGALSRFLRVPGEYEKAVAAALGDYLDAVLLGEDIGVGQALDLLEKNPGKAALLPMMHLAPLEPVRRSEVRGCIGVASELVEANPELRPVIDLLLGQVYVVEDREAARLVLRGQAAGVQAVTLKGEVFHSSGTVLVNSAAEGTVLSRPRERKELAEKIEAAEARLTGLEQDRRSLDEQLDKERGDILRLEVGINKATELLEEERGKFQGVLLETEQVRNSVNWHESQLAVLNEEALTAEEQIAEIGSAKEKIESDLSLAQESIRKRTAEAASLDLDESQANLTHWEKVLAVGQRDLREARSRQEERQGEVDRIREQIQGLNEQQGNVENQLAALKSQVDEMRDFEGGIGEQIGGLQSQIEPSEKELQEAEQKQVALEEEEMQSRQLLNMAERHHSQAQIALARSQEALETLRMRIEDDFGLVAFEYEQDVSGPTPLPLGDMVERLDVVEEISPDLEQDLKRKRVQLRRMGAVNPEAHQEYLEVKERYEFLTSQMEDLEQAEEDIKEVIAELDALMSREFRKTFDKVAGEFRDIFGRLFRGGSARLMLTDEVNMNEAGVDIEARLPGKRMQRLALLSGGERAMTAVALVFALIKASPTPFCVLDEVDAPLDEANIERLREILLELAENTQFVIITHNRNTVQVADLIYGITLGRDTTSQTISLRLEDVDESYTG